MENGRRRASRALIAVGTGLTLTLSLALVPGASQADPQPAPPTIEQVRKQIDDLEHEAEAATERANEIDDQLADITKRVSALQGDVTRAQATVTTLRNRVGQFAAAQYRSDGMDTTVQLLLADQPDDFLDRMSTTASLTDQQGASLTALQAQQKVLAEKQAAVTAEQARLTDAQNRTRAEKTFATSKLAESRDVLAKLTAAERARLAALEAAAERRQAAEVARATRGATRDAINANTGTSKSGAKNKADDQVPTEVSASGRGATALAFARAQLGEPYVFNAAGPGAWDCSGLTMMAWRAAGVSLPHSSRQQYNVVGHKVSKSELQPGDLVMFFGSMSHVGLYAGNGMVLHAPRPGKSVQYIPMKYMSFAGAVRPG